MTFIVPGEPKAQGRPRFTTHGGFPRAYDPKTSVDFKARVALCAKESGLISTNGAVKVSIEVHIKRPQAMCRKKDFKGLIPCGKRPDCDNYAKSVMDALSGIAFRDDGQVQELLVRKWYHEIGGSPRTEISIEAFPEI